MLHDDTTDKNVGSLPAADALAGLSESELGDWTLRSAGLPEPSKRRLLDEWRRRAASSSGLDRAWALDKVRLLELGREAWLDEKSQFAEVLGEWQRTAGFDPDDEPHEPLSPSRREIANRRLAARLAEG